MKSYIACSRLVRPEEITNLWPSSFNGGYFVGVKAFESDKESALTLFVETTEIAPFIFPEDGGGSAQALPSES